MKILKRSNDHLNVEKTQVIAIRHRSRMSFGKRVNGRKELLACTGWGGCCCCCCSGGGGGQGPH